MKVKEILKELNKLKQIALINKPNKFRDNDKRTKENYLKYLDKRFIDEKEILDVLNKVRVLKKGMEEVDLLNQIKNDLHLDKSKIKIYCKNPSCFTHYLANNKIKEIKK